MLTFLKIFSQKIDFLKDIFSKNGYPEDLFNSCLRRFLNYKCGKEIPNSKVKEDTVETIFSIPYIGLPSVIFSKKIKELFKKYYGIDIRVVFTSFKVKKLFFSKMLYSLTIVGQCGL